MNMEKSRKTLKSIIISEAVFLVNLDTTDEVEVTRYLVNVDDRTGTERITTEEVFDTQVEAETYAADIATRPLRPYDPTADLFATR